MCTGGTLSKQIEEARNSGEYSTASIDMFEQIDKIDIDNEILSHIDWVNDSLNDYLNEILELKDSRPGKIEFLKYLKKKDIVNNHVFEEEDTDLLEMYAQLPRETAIDRLIKYYKNGKQLTGRNLLSVHNALLYGTSSDDGELIRKANDKFVGGLSGGELFIDYFPMDYKDIPKASDKLAELYNCRLTGNGFDNVFLQPFLVHGMLGALQMFNDGNTRLGRIMQHALIWQLINERWNKEQSSNQSGITDIESRKELLFELPPLYATSSYFPLRPDYRKLIAMLVKENNSKVWNKWFDFNLDRIEDTIDVRREKIKELKIQIKYGRK